MLTTISALVIAQPERSLYGSYESPEGNRERPGFSTQEDMGPGKIIHGWATHYGGGLLWGDSVDYNGQPMGCGGIYSSWDETIAASPYRRNIGYLFPCGTMLNVQGPAGKLVVVIRDACPGCSWETPTLDLSESGHQIVCGYGTCEILIEILHEQ